MGTLGPLVLTLLFLIMNNITNKQLNDLYTAIFILEHHRDEIEKSMPSSEYDDVSTFMLYNDTKDSIKSLKELGKVLRSIRAYQAKGYHA